MIKSFNAFFKRPGLKSLVTQLILSHVFLTSFTIALSGIFLLTATNNFIRLSVNQRNLEKAAATAQEIHSFVENRFDLLSFTAKFPDVTSMERFRLDQTINNLKLMHDYFRNIYVADLTGRVIESTELGSQSINSIDSLKFPGISRDEEYISSVMIIENEPVITFSTPIYKNEKFTGSLIAEIGVRFIWDLVDSLSERIEGGAVYVLDNNGRVISHPDRRLVYRREELSRSFTFINDLLEGNTGTAEYNDIFNDNVKCVCAFTPVERLNWGIVVSQRESVAYSVFYDLVTNLVIIIVGSLILAYMLAVIISQNLVRPINELANSVKRIYEGSLASRTRIPNIKELATLANEFNRMTENLENVQKKLQMTERLATMSKFASIVAHEIRNPFNSIVINMQILKRGITRNESSERLENFMNIIDMEIRRIDGLINNYLSLTRVPELTTSPADLNKIIHELIALNYAAAEKQSVVFTFETDIQEQIAEVDRNQIKQAFLNIILNALQAMPNGGELTISVQHDHDDPAFREHIRILFRDNGGGIAPEVLPNVFEHFYTTKKSGTGLGLTVTQQIIREHKGEIKLSNRKEKGAVVCIYFPALK
ncbi:ATP-binding protein [candidate division KSB1 bacterium]